MKTPLSFQKPYLHILFLLLFSVCSSSLRAATFPVINLNATGPGSLSDAINAANANGVGFDDITFTVAGTITLVTPLPTINGAVFINGGSAPGYVVGGPPVIAINANTVGGNGMTLLPNSAGSIIQGLNIHNASANGMILIGSSNSLVQGCYIGTNITGTAAMGNGARGIQVEASSNSVMIGGPNTGDGNVVSGNSQFGIVFVSCNDGVIAGNKIGTNAAGTAAIGNLEAGIQIFGACNSITIGGNTANLRNVISGNGVGTFRNGIDISNGPTQTSIIGNYIGVDITGTLPLGNAENGISVFQAPQTTIGGAGANEGNVISDHNFHAIVINNGSDNSNVYGNRIGTNATGTVALGNDDSGVIVIDSDNVNIGGANAGEGNLLSGSISEYGVFIIGSTGTMVKGNNIGTDFTGTIGLPNAGGGIRVDGDAANNTIGGLLAGEANNIGFNTGYGVGVVCANCTGNLISGNSIFCNTGKGIDLNSTGNANHPSPAILSVTPIGASGTATANDVIELFYDDNCAGVLCQGETFIGTVTATAGGVWTYAGAINTTQTLVVSGRTSTNNTSEFECTIVLPIDLSYFEVELNGENTPVLEWSVIDEAQVDMMHVQRRVGNTPFENIATLDGNGEITFTYKDTSVGNGIIEYRIESIDFAGVSFFSDVRTLTLDAEGPAYSVFPNPVSQYIQLTTQVEGDATVKLFDTQGREIKSWKISIAYSSEKTTLKLNVSDLADGYYHLSVNRRGKRVNIPVFIGN